MQTRSKASSVGGTTYLHSPPLNYCNVDGFKLRDSLTYRARQREVSLALSYGYVLMRRQGSAA